MADYPFLNDIFGGGVHIRNAQWEIEIGVNPYGCSNLNKATTIIAYIRQNHKDKHERNNYVNILFCPERFRDCAKELAFILDKQVPNNPFLALSVCDFYRVLRVTFPEKFKDFDKEENNHG